MPTFSMSRSIHVAAPPELVHALVNDFRQWVQWSPWEGLDPDLKRTYGGSERGIGSTYDWSGNSKAGEGRMEITDSTDQHVVVDLEFLKPFKATNVTTFDLAPANGGTDVTWTMAGTRGALMTLMGKLFFDKAIGKDFDKGLASLKAAVEQP